MIDAIMQKFRNVQRTVSRVSVAFYPAKRNLMNWEIPIFTVSASSWITRLESVWASKPRRRC